MNYDLPKSVEIDGKKYAIRTDFREILDIFEAMNDPDLTDEDKSIVTLNIFYYDMPPYEVWNEALKQFVWFVNMGEDEPNKARPKLMDWSQDFNYIVAPVSRVIGKDVRGIKHLHWWTFLGWFMEIGECTYSTVLNIRSKRAKGKKLEQWEKEFFEENKSTVLLTPKMTESEKKQLEEDEKLLKELLG